MRKRVFLLLLLIVGFVVAMFNPQEAEASFLRGKWKTEYSEIGDSVLAMDYCKFSIFIKECHASEARDIRVYHLKK
jgi:hypothetical protein